MTYPVWPKELCRFERDSWQVQPQDGRLRRQADTGPQGYRRRFSAAARIVTLSLVLTRNEKAAFDRFYDIDCSGGAGFFRMPDPTTQGWKLMSTDGRWLTVGGKPLLLSRQWLCAWGEQPPVESIVNQIDFRKSFSVQVMP